MAAAATLHTRAITYYAPLWSGLEEQPTPKHTNKLEITMLRTGQSPFAPPKKNVASSCQGTRA